MRTSRTLALLLFLFFQQLLAEKPRLVVLIVLDQFPYEYLTKFDPYFSANGFHYLARNGANFTNAHYEDANTKTGPGHAALSTGTYSHLNGIISNRWYDRKQHQAVNCVDDDSVRLLGTEGIGKSPYHLEAYTLGDMLRLQSNFRSKVISIANKDRSAVLMGGKLGMAFWIEDSILTTSSYYLSKIPPWVSAVNTSKEIRQYYRRYWTEVRPAEALRMCDDDDAPYEADVYRLGRTFPHFITGDDTAVVTRSYYSALETTPYSTELLLNIVRKATVSESLGMRGVTDLLAIGIAATDEIGHSYGPMSHEVFDNALRTDEMLGEFLKFLDHEIGLTHCVIVLTSDHGIAPIPEYLKKISPGFKAGRVSSRDISGLAESYLVNAFGKPRSGDKWIERVAEADVYLNLKTLAEAKIQPAEALKVLKDSLMTVPYVAGAYTQDDIKSLSPEDLLGRRVSRTTFPRRSGDLLIILKPFYIVSGDRFGTNHGQPYEYDSHVPLIIMGTSIVPGVYRKDASPIDIVPTLAEVLGISPPPACEGKVLLEAVR